jgi:hypothetical protein
MNVPPGANPAGPPLMAANVPPPAGNSAAPAPAKNQSHFRRFIDWWNAHNTERDIKQPKDEKNPAVVAD